ncbi:hypothetical protein F4775DRAFT_601398 [Biscogniauxia sp. FL1348]|nr:hypothetical protein F4775DRAFT_601398 [Biscogniauxia sp. FL1348]
MKGIQSNPATPVKQADHVNKLQQTTPPPSYKRKIMIKVPERHDEDMNLTPLSPTPTTTTPTHMLTKKHYKRFNQYFTTKQERQPAKDYLAKFTDPEERRKKVLNMIHSMYPSDEAFHSARNPFYSADEHGYYDDFIADYMYEGIWKGHDEDSEYEDDPMHSRDVWEPRIGDDGIDTQEDLDMVLAMRQQYNTFYTNISVTKAAHREASRLAQQRDPDGHPNSGSESEPEPKVSCLVFGDAKKKPSQPAVVWPLLLVRSSRRAPHIVPQDDALISLSAHERARLEAERDPGLRAVLQQEAALWHERKWRQGDLVWRDERGRVARERHVRELQAHLDRAKTYWYRELRRPKTKTKPRIITLTIRRNKNPPATEDPQTAAAATPDTLSPSSSPSPPKRGRGRGRPRKNPGSGKRRRSALDAAYDPSFDGNNSSGEEKPSRRGKGGARAKKRRMGMDGACDRDGDAVMTEGGGGGDGGSSEV